MLRQSAILALLCLPLTAISEQADKQTALQLEPYILHYQSTAKGFDVDATRQLEPLQEDSYRLSQKAEALFSSIEEEARFHMVGDRPQPTSYNYRRNVFGSKLSRSNTFAEDNSHATFQEDDGDIEEIATDGHVYGELTFQLALRLQLIQYGELRQTQFRVVDEDRVREQEYRLDQAEWLQTRVGWLKTRKLERVREDNDKQTFIWLAEDFNYVIVRIEHRKGDKASYTLHLEGGTVSGKEITGVEQKPATAPADSP